MIIKIVLIQHPLRKDSKQTLDNILNFFQIKGNQNIFDTVNFRFLNRMK